ncbi:NADH-quinone oxidoreductase subunit C [Asticcacaulis sp. ZE23SCel15]|uniref:NADH-quinone oxidoreductase subunit C n=1 Tax=Asticcacaulis sp. ZE23SCel15 TaxID=3059027 RepID=UPI00265F4CAE|nr:NADH-quinone oxidoreductase subunit C [Asticcacaulis sp. ZE23SCel15]WKL56587.1 NADH-quinone oxidoreductase subunit C [Asticcacaulis sp. ZE23SCel15]
MSLEKLNALTERAKADFKDGVLDVAFAYGELTLTVERERIIEIMAKLKDGEHYRFHQLIDLTGVDYPKRDLRFDVVYHLLSLTQNLRIRVKVMTDEVVPVASLREIYPNADWYEREAFDMYGILFANHPDLRRLLTDYGFEGHPLRKDFPMTGHVEVRYDEAQKRVVYEPVKLVQEFRKFDFMSPWEGASYVLPGDEKASS